jgi:hypothetical protein
MPQTIQHFHTFFHAVFSSYFSQEKEGKTDLFLSESQWLKNLLLEKTNPTKEEQIIRLREPLTGNTPSLAGDMEMGITIFATRQTTSFLQVN